MIQKNVIFLFIGVALVLGAGFLYFRAPTEEYLDIQHVDEEVTDEHVRAVFSGGCFWCSESDFEKAPGVVRVISGYAGGTLDNPTYEQVNTDTTGHREAVEVYYDPDLITYEQLLEVYWRHIDPTDNGGQFSDRGFQYSTAIFYFNEEQQAVATLSKETLEQSGKFEDPIVTSIIPFTNFFPAEDYHQDYYKKNSSRYKRYRNGSGRNAFILNVWKDEPFFWQVYDKDRVYTKPSPEKLKKLLSPLSYEVTQQNGTERAFSNSYHNNTLEGIYVDIVSGEPLFSSTDK